MLAEIYMLQMEATARAAKDADTVTRSTSQFVPIPSPPVKDALIDAEGITSRWSKRRDQFA
jgi:hypothetical protein